MLGATAKDTLLLAVPPIVTTKLPPVDPPGTGTTICVGLQLRGVALVPLKVTTLVPWVAPKPVPVMLTEAPTAPTAGDIALITGDTVMGTPLLDKPLTAITTLPLVAPSGTVTIRLLELHEVTGAGTPLKLTVLVP